MTYSEERSAITQPNRFGWAADAVEQRQGEILLNFEARLRAIRSPLLSQDGINDLLRSQATAITEDVAGVLRGRNMPSAPRPGSDRLSKVVGTVRANTRVHPSESLRAGTELAESILAGVVEETPEDFSREEVAELASVIYRNTIERVARASISYVDHLLSKVHESHADERRRISREIHDRVSSSLAVVHHHLELYETLKDEDADRAEAKLKLIHDAARDALASSKELSTELRRSVAREGLEVALSNLLPAVVPKSLHASISVTGDESLIPDSVKDELFLVIREAVRNATNHSKAERMRIEIEVSSCHVRAAVLDDGKGFDINADDFIPGTGLEAMKERTSLIGGTFRVSSKRGEGAKVEVQVPIGRDL